MVKNVHSESTVTDLLTTCNTGSYRDIRVDPAVFSATKLAGIPT